MSFRSPTRVDPARQFIFRFRRLTQSTPSTSARAPQHARFTPGSFRRARASQGHDDAPPTTLSRDRVAWVDEENQAAEASEAACAADADADAERRAVLAWATPRKKKRTPVERDVSSSTGEREAELVSYLERTGRCTMDGAGPSDVVTCRYTVSEPHVRPRHYRCEATFSMLLPPELLPDPTHGCRGFSTRDEVGEQAATAVGRWATSRQAAKEDALRALLDWFRLEDERGGRRVDE